MRKRWKILITFGVCLIPVSLLVLFSNSWSSKTPISCVGSSGVKPFIEDLSALYEKENKDIDITVEAGGSGFGIQQIANGYANIGDASKDPYKDVRKEGTLGYRDQWIDHEIKTVTIGWEAICLVYIPPNGVKASDIHLSIDDSKIADFMRVFSGIDEGIQNKEDTTLGGYYLGNDSQVKAKLDNTPIIPYVRAGGSLTSGTASSFVNNTNLNFNFSIDLNEKQQNAFSTGGYGTNFGIEQTDEANSRAWDIFAKDNRPGQIVYLSSGFVQQNQKLIDDKGYGIFQYKGTPFDINSVDTVNGYNWFRPLNCLLSTKDENSAELKFMKKIVEGDYDDELKSIGAKPLAPDETSQMFASDDSQLTNWLSDVDLAKTYSANWDWPESTSTDGSDHAYFAPLPKGIN